MILEKGIEPVSNAGAAGDSKPVKPAGPVVLSEQQKSVLKAVEAGHNILITGPAGTGKSTLLKAMREKYGYRMPIVGSTGIAAVQVGGNTFHSWAGLGMAKFSAKAIARNIIDNNAKAYMNIRDTSRLAVDEVSMISMQLLDKINEVFQIVRKNSKPFGGMQMIFFGDFLQLPPVITGDSQDPDGFCFQAKSWIEADVRVCVLTKIFRQEDAEFATALNDIRVGHLSETARKILNSRYQKEDPNPTIRPVTVHTHNADVDAINEIELNKLTGEEKIYQAREEGKTGALALLQKNCLAPLQLKLKVGAQVMLLTNLDTDSGLANGSVGIVTGFVKMIGPSVKFSNGCERILERNEFTIEEGGRVLASRTQYPLRLAYAITAHKSQGMTLDKIEVFLAKVFEYGQAYVALSRVKTVDGLFIQSGNKQAIRAHPDALEFYANCSRVEDGASVKDGQDD